MLQIVDMQQIGQRYDEHTIRCKPALDQMQHVPRRFDMFEYIVEYDGIEVCFRQLAVCSECFGQHVIDARCRNAGRAACRLDTPHLHVMILLQRVTESTGMTAHIE